MIKCNQSARNAPSVEILIVSFDEIGALLTNHVDSILNATVWNDRKHRRINYSDILQAVHLESCIDYALLDVL